MNNCIHFSARITVSPFGSHDHNGWWKDHEDITPLRIHLQRLSHQLFLFGKEHCPSLTVRQLDDHSSLYVLVESDSMFVDEEDRDSCDPIGRLSLLVCWDVPLGQGDSVTTIIQEWDESSFSVISQCNGIGSVSCDVYADVDLSLACAQITDKFGDLGTRVFRYVNEV